MDDFDAKAFESWYSENRDKLKMRDSAGEAALKRAARIVWEAATDRAFENGFDAGYSNGMDAGYETGYSIGEQTGYDFGYSDGQYEAKDL